MLFAVALCAVLGLGAGLGAAVGPINIGGSPSHAPGNPDPTNTVHGGG